MQIKKIISTVLIATTFCSLLIIGCNKNITKSLPTTETLPSEVSEVVSKVPITEEQVTETITAEVATETISEVPDLKTITITVINTSDIHLGMFSAINPITNEQMNFNRLDSGTSLSFECNWPSDITEFQWALYNESGDLCLEAKTNLSGITKTATLLLKGEGSISDVDVTIE